MNEQGIRDELKSRANALLRAATRSEASERNRDAALLVIGETDRIVSLAQRLYACPDNQKAQTK